MGRSEAKWTAGDVADVIANPVYTGLGPYPPIVTEDLWLKSAVKMVRKDGAHAFLRRMLRLLRGAFSDEGTKIDVDEPATEMRTLFESLYFGYFAADKAERALSREPLAKTLRQIADALEKTS